MHEMTPRTMDRERRKIGYMGEPANDEVLFSLNSPAAGEVYIGEQLYIRLCPSSWILQDQHLGVAVR
jgi:hypothetical protein